jgi:hypothetical protein
MWQAEGATGFSAANGFFTLAPPTTSAHSVSTSFRSVVALWWLAVQAPRFNLSASCFIGGRGVELFCSSLDGFDSIGKPPVKDNHCARLPMIRLLDSCLTH